MLARSICKYASFPILLCAAIASAGCNSNNSTANNNSDTTHTGSDTNTVTYLSQPLVTNIYTADPSAHVFNGTIYIYPSHDTDTGAPEKDDGSHFAMKDYHILSMDSIPGPVVDH